MYGIFAIIGFSAFPDEFGYWSVAAAILGYDWSSITGLGPYYSYGYSVLLTPILFLFQDPIITYRMAIVLNLLLQCASFWVLYLILKELFPDAKKTTLHLVVAIGVLYPAWSFYTQTTMTEAVLYCGFVTTIYLMLRFVKKPSALTGLPLVVLTIYLYLVHMRCLGNIGAVALTILIFLISKRKDDEKKHGKTWLILILVVILFGVSFLLKDKVVSLLYHSTSKDMMTWNDYSGLLYRFSKFLSLQGFIYLLKDICGKTLYMGLATYGIAYFGIAAAAKKAFFSLKAIRQKSANTSDYLWLYIFLAVCAQFMVALIYLNGASAPDADRLDNFLHGRYIDFFLPILIAVGLLEMLKVKRPVVSMAAVLLIYLVLSYVALGAIRANNVQMNNPHGFTMIGMSYLLETPLIDTATFFYREVLFQTGLTILVFALILLARKLEVELLMAGIMILQIFLTINACDHFIFPYQNYIYGDIILSERVKELHDMYPEKEVVHIYEGGNPYIELVQFSNRDLHIKAVDMTKGADLSENLRDDCIIITRSGGDCEATVQEYYSERYEAGHLALYYTP